jgi:type IV secretion system protein TrbL
MTPLQTNEPAESAFDLFRLLVVAAIAADTASAPAASAATDGPPAWAKRMKRSQQMTHGVQAAAHAVRSGDSHGGGSSVNLSESD